ncbi:MAG TPA: TetR/AcrR family transcriptional regulator [Thermoleophilaceae bacterium]|nr:TetR/AcrR family transcriptional regulator [Thermoleophilaceae bacterium]
MTPRRLSRAEQREHTRTCLVVAAAKVFSRRGYDKASLDEVAEEAGFTKGAVYSNFKGKEDLFLATIDAHFEERLAAVKRVMGEEPDERGTAHAVGMEYMQQLNSDPEYFRLFFEFWAYAQRNPAVKRKFLPRVQRFRAALAEVFDAKTEQGFDLPVPTEQLAAMLIAMGAGVAMERELDPEAVADDTYALMLQYFFRGMLTPDEAAAGAAATPA